MDGSAIETTVPEVADLVAHLKKAKKPDLAAYAGLLFRRASAEDLTRLSLDDLARYAEKSLAFIETRKGKKPKVRVENPDFHEMSDRPPVTVIDIVNPNMPFLLDSVMDLLQAAGHVVDLVVHPILTIERTRGGKRSAFHRPEPDDGDRGVRESIMHIHVRRIEVPDDRKALARELEKVLEDVRVVVADWKPMRKRLSEALASFKTSPPPIPVEEIAEAIQFLEWLLDNNFTLLGMREYAFSAADKGKAAKNTSNDAMNQVGGSGLGILRDPEVSVLRRAGQMVQITPEISQFLQQPAPLIITKANMKSTVHRRAYMDYVGVKIFNDDGTLHAELRVVGLFTSTAYTRSAQTIPFLRRKLDQVIRRAGFDAESHSGKALVNVLENYPRDELFQIDVETLSRFSTSIMLLDERPRVRVLARPDRFDRFVSILVFVPRERYNTNARLAIGEYLRTVYEGRLSAFYPAYPEGPLARVHFIIGRDASETPRPSQEELEETVARLIRTWDDGLKDALVSGGDANAGSALYARYSGAFDGTYRAAFTGDDALRDITVMESLSEARPLAIGYEQRPDDPLVVDLRMYHVGKPITLSDRMPIIENMGFRAINERTYRIKRQGEAGMERLWVHVIALSHADGEAVDLKALGSRLEAAFMAVWRGQAEDDGYNALVLRAGIPWRDVALLRAYSRYLRQAGMPYSQDYMWSTLNTHHSVAAHLVDYFHARFNPHSNYAPEMQETRENAILADLEAALADVSSLDEDRIIRRFLNAITASLRTNYFQIDDDGQLKPTITFKFDPHAVEGLPAPRPFREIFVYSPRVEGVHLRFGPVARGGLRWSDRPQDFRTEVLGLVKAQQVKNAVIVPVGSKGGFVPKHLPVGGSREDVFEEGRESYKVFINSLLDITDNLDGDTVIPPADVKRLEGDDPYLVVAADKGTATFSDTANAISQAHDFWLDDAFASGGSAGYDHKKMGITARGGWEAVKRHFREMDWDIQSQPFTVVGCGDMSGDVFGNGMLLSEHIRLVAAFDHRDIFVDPDPDPARTFKERKRLFDMGRSSWQDYNTKLLSKGGMIFPRSSKSLTLTPEIQAVLDIKKARVSPLELINAILKANADLLWFGGIGTYVKQTGETDEEVGDRANDAVRITASELRVKVVGEGANLGMTQKARIAFGMFGGRINSDAIDNSAGVNSSDVEVNIKIALGAAVRAGKLTTPKRNALLAQMTDEVAALVLRNNYQQTLSLSLAEQRGLKETEFQGRFMTALEGRGLLDRHVEDLPDQVTLAERIEDGKPLTRPELAVVLAYAKITLFDDLIATDVPDDPYLARDLFRYFPVKMQKKYAGEIEGHRLRREIIATMLANSMINRGGPVFVHRTADQTGADVATIARAFAVVRDSFGMTALNGAIDALDTRISGDLQLALYTRVQDLLWQLAPWFIRQMAPGVSLEAEIGRFSKGIGALVKSLAKGLPADLLALRDEDREALVGAGVDDDTASRLANIPHLVRAPDIIQVSETTGASVANAAKAYFSIGDQFGTARLVRAAEQIEAADYYDRVALSRALDGVAEAQRRIAMEAVGDGKDGITKWLAAKGAKATGTRDSVAAIADDAALTVSKVTVASALLRDLAPA